jgi:hypothetical protein
MAPRERMAAALDFQPVDTVPLVYHPSPRGFYEHGEKLRALFNTLPDDLGTEFTAPLPVPPPGTIGERGEYREFITDEWGVEWECLIFGMMGHPSKQPLDDFAKLRDYTLPASSFDVPGKLERTRQWAAARKEAGFYTAGWAGGIFERLIALRRYEDVLMDIADDAPEIHELADRVCGYVAKEAAFWVAAGVDAVRFGDDYGTQDSLIFSLDGWRGFFKPRLKRMLAPVKAAGKKALFHSCGQIGAVLGDLKEVGADSIWTQLSVYSQPELGALCREIGLAVEIHIDRAGIMTRGTPEDVSAAVSTAMDAFKPLDGGAWFYIEIDNGFPYDNIVALIESVRALR